MLCGENKYPQMYQPFAIEKSLESWYAVMLVVVSKNVCTCSTGETFLRYRDHLIPLYL